MNSTILRIITCGSVDDGKSTLIGRILLETNNLPIDIIEHNKNKNKGKFVDSDGIDLSQLTDGLEAEIEQKITIDVSYKSISLTNGKRLIMADCPGHESYTRNMMVGASNSEVALVLIDAKLGIRPQTIKHFEVCEMAGIKNFLFVINKLDLFNDSEKRFKTVKNELFDELELKQKHYYNLRFIPISALKGININLQSSRFEWNRGRSLLQEIENLEIHNFENLRCIISVQNINISKIGRGYSGRLYHGGLELGQLLKVARTGETASVIKIINGYKEVKTSSAGCSVTIYFDRELDISRGDLLIHHELTVEKKNKIKAKLVNLSENSIVKSRSYVLKSNNFETPAIIRKIKSNNLKVLNTTDKIEMNEIVEVEMVMDSQLPVIAFEFSKYFGNFILIDRQNFETVAAGNVIEADEDNENLFRQSYSITRAMRADIKLQDPKIIWLTGLSGSGKSTIANELDKKLTSMGKHSFVLDGDNLRLGINKDLNFSESDRSENIRRISEIAKLMFDAGLIVIVATISPFFKDRLAARKIFPLGDFIEVYVDTPLEECIRRDSKGLYAKAQQGTIKNFTGTQQIYEPPISAELTLKNLEPVEVACESIIKELNLK